MSNVGRNLLIWHSATRTFVNLVPLKACVQHFTGERDENL